MSVVKCVLLKTSNDLFIFCCPTNLAILVTLLDMNEKPTRPPARKLKVHSAKPPMTRSQETTATNKTTDPPAPSIDITTANINVTTATSAPSINMTKTHSIAITSAPSINIKTASSINVTTATSSPSINLMTATSAPSIYITTTPSMDTTTANIASSVEITTAPTAPNVDTTTQEKKRKSTRNKGMRKHRKKMWRRKGEKTGKPGRRRVEQPIKESISLVYRRERNHD